MRAEPSSPTTRDSPGASRPSPRPAASGAGERTSGRGRRDAEQPRRGWIQAGDLAVEAEHDDAGRRDRQHLRQEVVLLGEAHALVAQAIDHAVVERDQLVDVGLADRQEARRERLVVDEAAGVRGERPIADGAPDEADADRQRRDQRDFDADQRVGLGPHQPAAEAGQRQVHHHEVGDQPRPEAHTVISYFSKRR